MPREEELRAELGRLNEDGGALVGWRVLRSIAKARRIDNSTRLQLERTTVGRKLLKRLARAIATESKKSTVVFLAHSFHARDAKLVAPLRRKLKAKRLRVITGEKPAPRSVSAKVLDRIDATRTFVALLTTDPTSGQPSPWIVSELGYAARKPRVILLERPLQQRQIGGIQGDIEYIAFNREAPESALERAARSASEG